jgi:hypothetical protein
VTSNTLYGYAYLKVNFDFEKKDAYDIVLPLAVRALATLPGPVVAAPEMQESIRSLWGLTIPENVLRGMLPKMADRGYLNRSNYTFLVNRSALEAHGFEDREHAASQIYTRVRTGIATLLAKHESVAMQPDDAIERFLDTGATAFLSERPATLPTDALDLAANIIIAEYTGITEKNLKAGTVNNQAIDDIRSLARGDIIYKSIRSISESDLGDITGGRMENVSAYFDTRLILRLMGYEATDLQRPVAEMLRMCQATGCRPCVFRHTVHEVQEILRAAADGMYRGLQRRITRIDEYIIAHNLTKSDLVEESAFIADRLAEYGIEVRDTPPMAVELSIDEVEFDYILQTQVGYTNPNAKIRDLNSLSAIHRLRQGTVVDRLERCHAIFITNNGSLARAATNYFQRFFEKKVKGT